MQSTPSSPAIGHDGTIYVGSYYSDSSLYALNSKGSIKWRYTTGGGIYSSPTVDTNGVIYFGSTDANMYAVYPSGTVIWSYYMYSSIKSSPALDSLGRIYIGTTGGILYAMDPSGIPVWSTKVSTAQFDISSPVISGDGSIYIGSISSDRSLHSFSSSGTYRWRFATGGQVYATPAIAMDGSIIVTAYQANYVYCITPSGNLTWAFATSASSSTTSPVIGANGVIYVSADHLYAIHPSGSLIWLSLVNIYPQTPVISRNGVIYVGSGSTLFSVGNPIVLPTGGSYGLLAGSSWPKFKGNSLNTVI